MNELCGIETNGSEIMKIDRFAGNVKVSLYDGSGWENDFIFHDVFGFEAYSPLNICLEKVVIDQHSDSLLRACEILQEPPQNKFCYSFIAMWTNKPILTLSGGIVTKVSEVFPE